MAKSVEGDLEVKEALDKLASFAINYCKLLIDDLCSADDLENGYRDFHLETARVAIGSMADCIYKGIDGTDDRLIAEIENYGKPRSNGEIAVPFPDNSPELLASTMTKEELKRLGTTQEEYDGIFEKFKAALSERVLTKRK